MVDVTSATIAATPSAAPASAAVSPTLGQSLDAEITILKSRLATLESAGKTDWAALKARISKDWPHVVTWVSLAASSPIVIDIVKKIL